MIRGGAASLLALVVVAAAGCSACGFASPTLTGRGAAAQAPAPPPRLAPAEVRVLHIGDFGDATRQQRAVAAGLAASHQRAPFDLGLVAGDLVYECGPDVSLAGADRCAFAPDGNTVAPGYAPPADPAFEVHDRPLAFLGETPVYVALGNHDVGGAVRCGTVGEPAARTKACLAVARSGPQWRMPGRHYAVDRGPARFIVVDTNLVPADYGGFDLEDEVAFVAAQAEGCATRACFLVGHHPPATAGAHRADLDDAYVARMQRLVAAGRGRIRAFLAGHDHALIHVRTPEGLDVLVSGATARGRFRERFEATEGAALLFASARWGHGVLEVSPDGWTYRFEDERAGALYCCAAVGSGPCEPTACR